MLKILFHLGIMIFLLNGCAGIKVINPKDENKEKGTKMLDFSEGGPKIVSTFSCKLQSMGQKISAIGKTEKDARAEVLAKCHDKTMISFCKEADIKCEPN